MEYGMEYDTSTVGWGMDSSALFPLLLQTKDFLSLLSLMSTVSDIDFLPHAHAQGVKQLFLSVCHQSSS